MNKEELRVYRANKAREYRKKMKEQGRVYRFVDSGQNSVVVENQALNRRIVELTKQLAAAYEMIDALKAEIETLRFDNKKEGESQ